MKNNKNIVIFFCVVGLFISAYLSKHYVDVNINESSQSSICSVNKFFDCDELTKGAYSSVFKIPLSVYSFVFFIFIIFRTLVYYEKHRENALFCPFLFGLVCSITMFSISLFVEGKLCPFCSVLYLIHLLFFIKVFSPPSFLTFKYGFLWEIELI